MTVHQQKYIQRLTAPAEFKFAGDVGMFQGHAAVFGNVDQGGDVIVPGAFKEFKKTRDGKVLVLYQHDVMMPIGKADVREDSKGLFVHGKLVLEDPIANRTYTHMKAGTIDAMSIGYDVLPGGQKILPSGYRELSALCVWEVSAVTWGMNPEARISVVKSAMACESVRALEAMLGDALSLSSRKAKAAASALWPIVGNGQDDPKPDHGERIAVLKSLNEFIFERISNT